MPVPLPLHPLAHASRSCLQGLLGLVAMVHLLLVLPGPMPAHGAEARSCPADMVLIPGGSYRIGAGAQLPEEQPASRVRISPFCLGVHEVTNRQFARFVAATGYRTVAERPLSIAQFPHLAPADRAPGALVFQPLPAGAPIEELGWWHWVRGADWRHPEGPGSSLAGLENHPVVQVSHEDAEAYATWAGATLPSEAQWEWAARGGLKDRIYAWGNTWSPNRANTWQGPFPISDTAEDGFAGTAPVGSYAPTGYGLFDMTGNVWEWTRDFYGVGHGSQADRSDPVVSLEAATGDPREHGVVKHVIKGGSFLCSSTYCSRYRPAAREAQSPDSGTSHIGFRLTAAPTDA